VYANRIVAKFWPWIERVESKAKLILGVNKLKYRATLLYGSAIPQRRLMAARPNWKIIRSETSNLSLTKVLWRLPAFIFRLAEHSCGCLNRHSPQPSPP
jgi:hypothetical protein